jgi:hypothetical protein
VHQPHTPNPIPHLINAVNSLGLALRDLDARMTSRAVRQDSLEHAAEVEDLTKHLIHLLQEGNH